MDRVIKKINELEDKLIQHEKKILSLEKHVKNNIEIINILKKDKDLENEMWEEYLQPISKPKN